MNIFEQTHRIQIRSTISTSRLTVAVAIAVTLMLLLAPAAATTVPSFDVTRSRCLWLPLEIPRGALLRGPESLAFDGHGHGPYSGVSDGRFLKWNGDAKGWFTYTHSPGYNAELCTSKTVTECRCGRPLGLQFHLKSGDLYVADAYKGFMRAGPGGGETEVLVNEVDGVPLRFTNGVDVDQVTGDVYFTDSSMNYWRLQHETVTTTGDSTGRLIMYNPRTNNATVLQAGLTYPNGVAMSADQTHLVIASTGSCKQLLRYWTKGPKAGTSEQCAGLSGYPDNVRPDRRRGYWVALHGEKSELPFGGVNSHTLAVRIGADGKILEEMRGPKKVIPTEIVERDNGKSSRANIHSFRSLVYIVFMISCFVLDM